MNSGKKKSGTQQQDHYALLGLSNLRHLATNDQIRKSFREAALKHHPDKLATLLLREETEEAKEAKKEEINSHFRAIREAYEVLIDPARRRTFDFSYEFDDEVPSDCFPQDFFKVFGPAFRRYARCSVNQRIPDLGDENTPFKDVDKFYKFWFAFKSWMEFPDEGEYDLKQAYCRDERRWMEKENAKKTAKEHSRIRTLVDNAYRKDPRIVKRKEEVKAEKKREKEAKVLAKKKQAEEAAIAAEEEKRRKEEEEKRAKQEKTTKEKEKKLLRKERNRLRTLSAPLVAQCLLDISEEDIENLCMSLNTEQLQTLCDSIGNKQGLELAKVIKDGCNICRNDEADSKEKESKKTNGGPEPTVSQLDSTQKKQPWSKEEVEMLKKGIVKYPKGTSRRWEVVSEYIGTGRSIEEILKATKTVLLQKPDSAKAFDTFLEKRKPSASISSPLSTREELGESLPTTTTTTMAKPSKETVLGTSSSSQSSDNNGEACGSSDTDGWSTVQERTLIQALKTFPKETSQRWERVAAAVPGKTMNQCKKKFAELKETIRNKKTGV